MRLAAVILGILAGLGGLWVALLGEVAMDLMSGGAYQQERSGLLTAVFWVPPVLMLIGALAAIRWRIAGGALLLAGALGWIILGINAFTAAPILAAALAGILALLSARRRTPPSPAS